MKNKLVLYFYLFHLFIIFIYFYFLNQVLETHVARVLYGRPVIFTSILMKSVSQ